MEGVEGGKATDRYETFDAVRNLFGGASKGKREDTTKSLPNAKGRRKSDPRCLVKPPVPLADDRSEDISASERISQAKELAVILEARNIAEEQRVKELKKKSDRPSSARCSKKHQALDDPYFLLMEKASSISSLYSDKGYGTSSPKPSNGSLSPHEGSETNLLEDSLGSEHIGDIANKEQPRMAWCQSPDRRTPKRFTQHKQLVSSEDSHDEEMPELKHLRETLERLEARRSDLDVLKPGYSPQVESHKRITGEVRIPVPESKYKEFASEDKLEDSTGSLQKYEFGKFVQPKESPPPPQENKVEVPPTDTPPVVDSSAEECLTPEIIRGGPLPHHNRSASCTTKPSSLHQYMVKLQAKKKRLSVCSPGEVEKSDGDSPDIPRKQNPHQILENDEVLKKTMDWDGTIGEWVFEGKKQPYSPQMASKHEKRRSRQIHIPAPDSAYEAFLNEDEDDESWKQTPVQAIPGKFVVMDHPSHSNTTDGPEDGDNKQQTASSHNEENKQTIQPVAEQQVDIKSTATNETLSNDDPAILVKGGEKEHSDDGGEGEIVVTKEIENRAKIFGGVRLRRAKSFSASRSTCQVVRRKVMADDSSVPTGGNGRRSTSGISADFYGNDNNNNSTKQNTCRQSITIKIASVKK